MKIFIGWYGETTEENCNQRPWRAPVKYLKELGDWEFITPREIEDIGDFRKAVFKKCGGLPTVIFFWFNFPLIYKYKKVIDRIHCKKYCFIDDLHKEGKIKKLYYHTFRLMDIIFTSYAYVFPSFFPDVNPTKIRWLPHSVPDEFKIPFNNEPMGRLILSGCTTSNIYPMRAAIAKLVKKFPIDILRHPGYNKPKHVICGDKFLEHLNKYLVSFTCCADIKHPYIVAKFFEIPVSGSLLLAYDEYVKEPLKELGFIDGENYISVTKDNLIEKLTYIFDKNNRQVIDNIRLKGYIMANEKHLQSNRALTIHNIV